MRHLRILASAGTGKTYRLSGRYIELLRVGVAPSTILATTFTRKAAGEIRDRVLGRLAAASVDPAEAAKLGLAPAEAVACLERTVDALDALQIRTLDSFFAAVVTGFATELGMPPDLVPLDEHGTAALDEAALVALLDAAGSSDDPQDEERLLRTLESLNKGRPTARLAERLRHALKDTRTAVRESAAGAWAWPPRPVPLDAAGLAAAFARAETVAGSTGAVAKAVREDRGRLVEALRAGRLPDFETAVKACGTGMVKVFRNGGDSYRKVPAPAGLAEAYAPILATLEAIAANDYARQTAALHDLASAHEATREELKRRRGEVEFDDLVRVLGAASRRPELASIFFRLDGRIGHLLLDEFQDTSAAQWRALGPLLGEIVADRPPARSLFAVGDVKQSIYGWRGASPRLLAELPERLMLGGAGVIEDERLVRSHRSAVPVLEGVNRLFAWIRANSDLDGHGAAIRTWLEGFAPHESAHPDRPGLVELRTAPRNGRAGSTAERRATLETAADLVAELRRDHPGRSIAVLTRTNAASGETVNLLQGLGIPAAAFGAGALQDAAAVNAVLDCLVLADRPDHLPACFHVARSPLGPLVLLPADAHRRERAALRRAWAAEERERFAREGLAERIRRLAGLARGHADEREWVRLEQLVDAAARLERELDRLPPGDPRRRLAAVAEALRGASVEDLAADAVQVMTVHQSKGLDFDFTVVCDLDRPVRTHDALAISRPDPEGEIARVARWPDEHACPAEIRPLRAETEGRFAQEALSVLYVALTRARYGLFVVTAPPPEKPGPLTLNLGAIVRAAWAADIEPDERRVIAGDLAGLAKRTGEAAPATVPAPASASIPFAPPRGLRAIRSGAASERDEDERVPGPLRVDRGAADRGVAIHAMLEAIEWIDGPVPSESEFARAVRAALPRASDGWIGERVAEVRAVLATPEVRAILARPGADATVLRERPFVRRRHDGLQRGLIDRLVLRGDPAAPRSAEIIDFKTDAIRRDEAAEAARRDHLLQMRTYRDAVAERYGLKSEEIRLLVVYVLPADGGGAVADLGTG